MNELEYIEFLPQVCPLVNGESEINKYNNIRIISRCICHTKLLYILQDNMDTTTRDEVRRRICSCAGFLRSSL